MLVAPWSSAISISPCRRFSLSLSAVQGPHDEECGDDQGSGHHDEVGCRPAVSPKGVEAHGSIVEGVRAAGSVRPMFGVRDDGHVRWLTIDNPSRRNAVLSGEWARLAGLIDAFTTSEARVLVITGAGDDFCSGADVGSGLTGAATTSAYTTMAEVGAAAAALHRTPKPTIAAVDGVAVGAGMNLALGCDMVIATDRARFSEIFVKRGLTLDFGGTWLLPRLVGMARAKELALTGRVFGAEEASSYGLLTAVVPPGDLATAAAQMAAEVAAGAPLAQRFIKEGLDRSFEMSFGEALGYEQRAQTILFASEDVVEGVASFLQKRPPEFRGR